MMIGTSKACGGGSSSMTAEFLLALRSTEGGLGFGLGTSLRPTNIMRQKSPVATLAHEGSLPSIVAPRPRSAKAAAMSRVRWTS